MSESTHNEVSSDVAKVLGHLRGNKTTQREAESIRDAASRSVVDHKASRGFGNSDPRVVESEHE